MMESNVVNTATVGENEWDDWEEENEDRVPTTCLLCTLSFPSPTAVLEHLTINHSFNIANIIRKWRLDFYGTIKLVNYLRSDATINIADMVAMVEPPSVFSDESLLKPVFGEDPMLFFDFDEWLDQQPNMETAETTEIEIMKRKLHESDLQRDSAKEQLSLLQEEFSRLQTLASTAAFGDSIDNVEEENSADDDEESNDEKLDYYFDSYSHFGIHEEMLKDTVRTEAYRDFMYGNPDFFAGKVVLDVGCGTGILCMFAAKAGAKKVYGVDMSNTINQARDNVIENDFQGVIELFKGKVEEIELPVKNVDIIVSEWMGYLLLYESMLETVLFARDKWLAPDGAVHPDQSSLYIAGLSDDSHHQARLGYWDNVYGFKMSAMRRNVYVEPAVETCAAAGIITAPYVLKSFDMGTVLATDLVFKVPFQLVALADGRLFAFCTYFDVVFEKGCSNIVYFSTGPQCTPTHWKQTLLYISENIQLSKGDVVVGQFTLNKLKENIRGLDITVTYTIEGSQSLGPFEQRFFMR